MASSKRLAAIAAVWLSLGSAEPSVAADPSAPVAVDLGALDKLPQQTPEQKPGQNPGSADQPIRLRPPDSSDAPVKRAKPPVTARLQRDESAKKETPAADPANPAMGPVPLPSPTRPSPTLSSPAGPPAATPQRQVSIPPAIPVTPVLPHHIEGQILFQPRDPTLADSAKPPLDTIAAELSADPQLHLELVAFTGDLGDASEARRLSLTRAIAARNYLLDRGVDAKQVDLRPLGNRPDPDQPADRIDLVVLRR